MSESADKVRAELTRCATERVKAKGAAFKARQELLDWLQKAHEHPEVSKRECAQLLGLKHRETVYELLKERVE